jgi:hypothetical protein
MEKSHLNFVKQSNATYSSRKKWYLNPASLRNNFKSVSAGLTGKQSLQ